MKRLVKVTQQHINAGKRNDCWRCAITLAVKAAFPECEHLPISTSPYRVAVCESHGESAIIALQDADYLSAHVPHEVGKFIEDFDRGAPVEPFEFAVSEANFLEAARRWPAVEAA